MRERTLLSLCMIVRNEADVLVRCLESVAPVVDEMVIIDTGSTDRTLEIARSFRARVEIAPWAQDFSRARNSGLDLAAGTWILQLDADEELLLPAGGSERLRHLLVDERPDAYTFQIISPLNDALRMRHEVVRLWRNRSSHRFEGAVHEQILPSILRSNPAAVVASSGFEILHHGYAPNIRNQEEKARRNQAILQQAAREQPDDLFVRYNLGVSHLQLGQDKEASDTLGTVHEQMQGSEAWAPSLVRNYALALERCGNLDRALEVLSRGISRWSDYTESLYLQGFIFLHKHEYGRAMASWRQCTLQGEPPPRYLSTEGVGSYLALEQIGMLHMRLHEQSDAIAAFTAALRAKPDFPRPLYHLAKALRKLGHTPGQLEQFLEAHFNFSTTSSRLLLADVLASAGGVEQALAQVDRVLLHGPATDAARHLRGRLLLRLERFSEAVAELSTVDVGSPEFPPSQRLICLGRWLDHPPVPADDALRRLERLGQMEEACFLAEFQRLLLGGERSPDTYDRLPGAVKASLGVDLIEQFLELGARREASVAAEMIGDLIKENASLRLGKLFFRFGETESAAHWFLNGLKEESFDADSLKMLGEITMERDLFEEGEQLFAEALAMEPDSLEHQLDLARIYLKQAKRFLARGLTFVPGAALLKEELERVEACLRWL